MLRRRVSYAVFDADKPLNIHGIVEGPLQLLRRFVSKEINLGAGTRGQYKDRRLVAMPADTKRFEPSLPVIMYPDELATENVEGYVVSWAARTVRDQDCHDYTLLLHCPKYGTPFAFQALAAQ